MIGHIDSHHFAAARAPFRLPTISAHSKHDGFLLKYLSIQISIKFKIGVSAVSTINFLTRHPWTSLYGWPWQYSFTPHQPSPTNILNDASLAGGQKSRAFHPKVSRGHLSSCSGVYGVLLPSWCTSSTVYVLMQSRDSWHAQGAAWLTLECSRPRALRLVANVCSDVYLPSRCRENWATTSVAGRVLVETSRDQHHGEGCVLCSGIASSPDVPCGAGMWQGRDRVSVALPVRWRSIRSLAGMKARDSCPPEVTLFERSTILIWPGLIVGKINLANPAVRKFPFPSEPAGHRVLQPPVARG